MEEIEIDGQQREAETGRPPLGGDADCRQGPHHEPNPTRKTPAPLVPAVAPAVRAVVSYLDVAALCDRPEALRRFSSRSC
jgi:hypothetical protein